MWLGIKGEHKTKNYQREVFAGNFQIYFYFCHLLCSTPTLLVYSQFVSHSWILYFKSFFLFFLGAHIYLCRETVGVGLTLLVQREVKTRDKREVRGESLLLVLLTKTQTRHSAPRPSPRLTNWWMWWWRGPYKQFQVFCKLSSLRQKGMACLVSSLLAHVCRQTDKQVRGKNDLLYSLGNNSSLVFTWLAYYALVPQLSLILWTNKYTGSERFQHFQTS